MKSLRFNVLALIFFFSVSRLLCQNVTEDQTPAEKFAQTFFKLKKAANSVIKQALPYIIDQATDQKFQVSVACRNALFQYLVGINNMKPWAIHMTDATGKFVDGFLLGTLSSFGNYDQCVGIDVKDERRSRSTTGSTLFRGQYCTVMAKPEMPPKPKFYSLSKRLDGFKQFENDTGLIGEVTKNIHVFYILSFRAGICVPSLCSTNDIQILVNAVVKRFISMDMKVSKCEVKEDFKIDGDQVAVICTFSVLLLVLVSATIVDNHFKVKMKHGKKSLLVSNLGIRILRAFSVSENLSKLLDVEAGAQKLKVLHGIRFWTMTWIILGHTYFHINFAMLRNLKNALSLTTDLAFNILANANLAVENFFFISGLLLAFVSYQLKERAGATPKIWMFILHRLWRFLPMQMTFVGLTLLMPWFGSGPLWHESIDPLVEACRKDWWANLIFINNFYRSSGHGCVSHSWYLAADLQIYLITLIVIYFLFRKPSIGLGINFILFIASILTAGIYNYVKDLPPTMLFSQPDFEQRAELMKEVYYTPYHHLSSVCIGIVVGHYLQTPYAKKRLHPIFQVVAWLLAAFLFLSTLLGVHTWNLDNDQSTFVTALYAALSKVAWTFGIAWITWACSTGHGGILGKLLCWNAFVPLSRLTFAVYLIHPLIQRVFYANLRSGIEARNYLGVFIWFSFTVTSYLLGVIICICIESPFISLGSIIFEKHKERIDKQSAKEIAINGDLRFHGNSDTAKNIANGRLPHLAPHSSPVICTSVKFGSSSDGYICHL